jgi:hypothetical protein
MVTKRGDRTQPSAECTISSSAAVCTIFSGSPMTPYSLSADPPAAKCWMSRKLTYAQPSMAAALYAVRYADTSAPGPFLAGAPGASAFAAGGILRVPSVGAAKVCARRGARWKGGGTESREFGAKGRAVSLPVRAHLRFFPPASHAEMLR